MGRTILFSIGSIDIYTHGLFFVLAILISVLGLSMISRKFTENRAMLLDLITWPLISGIVLARILFILLYPSYFHNFREYFNLSQGGLVSWGGYAGGLIVAYIIIKCSRGNISKWMDAIFISGMLGIAVGRVGCLLSGEVAGKAYEGFLSISNKYPTTLLESLFAFLLFVALLTMYNRKTVYDGFWWKAALALYALGRFVIDFTRDEAVYLLGLSLGQLLSLAVAIFLIALIIIDFKKRGKYVN